MLFNSFTCKIILLSYYKVGHPLEYAAYGMTTGFIEEGHVLGLFPSVE